MSSLEYKSCQIGKHHRMPYPLRINKRVDHLFELVFSNNFWSLSCSFNKQFGIFYNLLNDFSHATWLYLRKSHSDVLSIF